MLQSTNPLARCVEHLQEDLETMTTEFNFWAEERRRFQVGPPYAASLMSYQLIVVHILFHDVRILV